MPKQEVVDIESYDFSEAPLQERIKQYLALPETDPTKYALLSEAYREESALTHETQAAYLKKVAGGRRLPYIRADQPAFSQAADDLRQQNALLQADQRAGQEPPRISTEAGGRKPQAQAQADAQDGLESYDFGAPQAETPLESYDFSEEQPVRPGGKSWGDAYQHYRPSWESPEPPTDPLAIPGYLATEAAKTGLGTLAELTAPIFASRDFVYGALAGHPGTVTSPQDIADSVREAQGTGPKTDQWKDWATDILPGVARGVTELVPFLGLGGKLRGPKTLAEVEPLVPKAARELAGITHEEQALAPKVYPFEDRRPVPPVKDERQLFLEGLSPEELTNAAKWEARGVMPEIGHKPPVQLKGSYTPTPDEKRLLFEHDPADNTPIPHMVNRIVPSVVDVMNKYGPIGEEMGNLTDWVYSARARDTSRDMQAVNQALDQILGKRGFWDRQKQAAGQIRDENVFVKGMEREWKMSEADKEMLFNYMDSGGREPITPKLRQVAQVLFERGTKPASTDPGVRLLSITDPITGDKFPMGEASMFLSHRPVTQAAKDALGETQWNLLYQRKGGESLGITRDEFKQRVLNALSLDPEVTTAKMRGLETARLLDLGSLGGSRYQWAKKLGLETDPYRAVFQYNAAARLRGNIEQVLPKLNALKEAIPLEDTSARGYLGLALERVALNKGEYDITTDLSKTLRGVSHITDVLMLAQGGLANVAQILYPISRGGFIPALKSFGGMLSKEDRALVNASGSQFPALLNEITQPSGPMATISSAAFRGYQLHSVDAWTRYFAGHVGNQAIKGYERGLLKDPSSSRMAGLIKELGGDPKTILEQGGIPEDMRLLMIQRFANYTAGVTDVRGVGLWLTSENPIYKLVNKYRNFSMANAAEIQRSVFNAPDLRTGIERGIRLVISGYAIGGGVNELRKAIAQSLMGDEAPKTKQDAAAHLERLALGLGAAHGILLVQLAARPEAALAGAVAGPSVGLLGRLIGDLNDTRKFGPGWRTLDTVSGLGPTGPVLGPLVEAKKKKEARLEAQRQRLLHEGFSQ